MLFWWLHLCIILFKPCNDFHFRKETELEMFRNRAMVTQLLSGGARFKQGVGLCLHLPRRLFLMPVLSLCQEPLEVAICMFSALKLANLNSAVTAKVFQTVCAVCLCLWHLHHSTITCTCVSLVCSLRTDSVSLIFEF